MVLVGELKAIEMVIDEFVQLFDLHDLESSNLILGDKIGNETDGEN